jgi:hypothetical protein
VPSECKAPAGAAITLENSHLVSVVTTPAGALYLENASGALVSSRSPLTEYSFLYWYPLLQNTAEGAECVLPVSEQFLCKAILMDAQKRLGERLDGRLKR